MGWGLPSLFPSRGTGRRAAGSQCLQLPLLLYTLQASPQKIDLQRLAADLAFQVGNPVLVGAVSAVTQKRLASEFPQLPLPAVQDVRIYLTGAGHLGKRGPQVQPPDGGSLKLFGELSSRQTHGSFLHWMKIEP